MHHLGREALVRRDLDVLHEGEERVLRLFVLVAAPGHAHAHAARDVADALRPHELRALRWGCVGVALGLRCVASRREKGCGGVV